jgi:hypothetical protein
MLKSTKCLSLVDRLYKKLVGLYFLTLLITKILGLVLFDYLELHFEFIFYLVIVFFTKIIFYLEVLHESLV